MSATSFIPKLDQQQHAYLTQFTLGSDPEYFLFDTKESIILDPRHFTPGTKEHPQRHAGGFYSQADGMAFEMNAAPCKASNLPQFLKNTLDMVNAGNIISNGTLNKKLTAARFTEQYWKDWVPDEAKVLGCDPDYNAYTGEMNPVPDAPELVRYAGGHVHVYWGASVDNPAKNEQHMDICRRAVKMLDATMGLFSVCIEGPEGHERRKTMYGKAGAFRPKSGGVEYRTPSNAWTFNDKRIVMTGLLIQRALRDTRDHQDTEIAYGFSENFIEEVINNNDVPVAEKALKLILDDSANEKKLFEECLKDD